MKIISKCSLLLAVGTTGCLFSGTDGDGDGKNDTGLSKAQVRVVNHEDGYKPVAGIGVAFHDASGATIAYVETDNNGIASAELTEPGLVTIASKETDGSSETFSLFTRLIDPDQEIEHVTWLNSPSVPVPKAQLAVGLPGAFPGALSYEVKSYGLFAQPDPSPNKIFVFDVGQDFKTVTLVGYALDAEGKPLAHAVIKNHDVSGLVPCENPGSCDDPVFIKLPAWRTDFVTSALTFNGMAANSRAFSSLSAQVNGVNPYGDVQFFSAYGEPGDVLKLPAGLADGEYQTEDGYFEGDRDSRRSLVVAQPASSNVVDVSTTLLPMPERLTMNATDPKRPTFAWAAPEIKADMAYLLLMEYPPMAEPGPPAKSWELDISVDVREVIVPQLPVELAAWLPTTQWNEYMIRYMEDSDVDGYEERYEKRGRDLDLAPGFQALSSSARINAPR